MKLSELPSEIQTLANCEIKKQGREIRDINIDALFDWASTPDGVSFWWKIWEGNYEPYYSRYGGNKDEKYNQLLQEFAELKAEFDQYRKESIKWSAHDFFFLDVEGYHITPENAQKALERMIEMHDAGVGINWDVVRFWFGEYCTPIAKYYNMKDTGNFYKKEKDKSVFVGEGGGANMICVYGGNHIIPSYYAECTEAEFVAAYTKVKTLLNDVQI